MVRDYFYRWGGQGCHELETVECLAAKLQHLFLTIIAQNTLHMKKSIERSEQSLNIDIQLHNQSNHAGNTTMLLVIVMKLRLSRISFITLDSGKGSVRWYSSEIITCANIARLVV